MKAQLKAQLPTSLVFTLLDRDDPEAKQEVFISVSKILQTDLDNLLIDADYFLKEARDGFWEIHRQ